MHGRVQPEGKSCRSLRRSSSLHMRKVLPLASTNNTVAFEGDHHSSLASSITTITPTSDSFIKDGRKISVGDCALFKPPKDSPPFVGLIRRLTLAKDGNWQIGVNWLYRPAELKLGKGTVLDGAPNEIFYSFHENEIPAASLLHPCKVAFLPRGAELPTGTSSFVCRRLYDIENKCLWWLTDQDNINDRQEEVNQLLQKTRIEMHGTLQPGGRSPKQVNGPTSASHLKSGSDNIQNSGISLPSQVKLKKRERGDHSADPVKRERSSRTDDGDSAQYKAGSSLKSDIARITEKGGVVDLEGVEKLIQLMQPDRAERKLDLVGRSMLAGVIAATEKVECLNRFVQHRGLPVLDEWLQDIHKGKVAGGNSSKDGDKSVDEFLLVLLRALDKLPVNLHSLQTCNIGRSVNHLRSHKNVEIQRKARSLVETWKKRVEAEMISNDAKSGSTQATSAWSSKSRLPEASHGGTKTPSGSDVAMKSSVTDHSASKSASVKSSHGESNTKSASSSPGPVKPASPATSGKGSQPETSVTGTPDAPLIREDRSSSSNQSHSYSQSISGKDEGKSSTAVSAAASKVSSGTSRNRKASGFQGVTGGQRENSSIRSSGHRSNASDKLLQSASASERVLDGPITEAGNHKFIVKIPNRVRSPTQGVSVASHEDPSIVTSRASSPAVSDKLEQFDNNLKEKNDSYQCNASSNMNIDSCQINDRKDVLTGSGDGAGSPAVLPEEEKSMSADDSRRVIEGPRKNQMKGGKLHESSFSPMNALIESCAKYSEAHSSMSLEDDVGMNLLASVATGEMSRSELVSPTDSTERSTPAGEEVCLGDEAKSKPSTEDPNQGSQSQSMGDAESDDKKQSVFCGNSGPEEGLHLAKQQASHVFSADRNCGLLHSSAVIPAGECNKPCNTVSTDLKRAAGPTREISEKSNRKKDNNEKVRDGEENKETQEDKAAPSSNANADNTANCKSDGANAAVTEDKAVKDLLNTDKGKIMVEVASSDQSCDNECKSDVNEGLDMGANPQHKLTCAIAKTEMVEKDGNEELQQNTAVQRLMSEAGDESKGGERDDKDTKNNIKVERESSGRSVNKSTAAECDGVAGLSLTTDDIKSCTMKTEVQKEAIPVQISLPDRGFSATVACEARKDDLPECASTVAEVSSVDAVASDPDTKMKFDLNEGFNVDDGKYGEPVSLTASGSTTIQMINTLPFSVNSIPSVHPASITVAAAAKGPFVPPEDLLRSKGELGWKGSAATSAFRPAEPRKFLETPFGSASTSCPEASTSKQGRFPLDIDLNVTDERLLEEMASQDSGLALNSTPGFVSKHSMFLNETPVSFPVRGSGGLDLDLNRADEASDNGNCSTSSNRKGEGPTLHVKPFTGLPTCDFRRDFDLNDGPGAEDANIEQFSTNQQVKGSIPPQLSPVGLRMNNPNQGNFSSWFSPTYSTIAIPSMLPDRGEHPLPVFPPNAPQRTFTPSGVTAFTPDIYRGSVLSSSPAVPYASSPFQFPVFPFGTTFPLPSATFSVGTTSYVDASSGPRLFAPPVHSQLLGPVGSVTSQFPRPYMVLPGSSDNNVLENSRKWGRQGLDLNAGPGAMDEVREEIFPLSSGQHSVARSVVSSQALAEEQSRTFSVSSGNVKRKEPEGGWENDSFNRFKQQSSWQ